MKSEDIVVGKREDGPFTVYTAEIRSERFNAVWNLSVSVTVEGEMESDPLLRVTMKNERAIRKELVWIRKSELLALIDTVTSRVYQCSLCGEPYTIQREAKERAPRSDKQNYCPSCRTGDAYKKMRARKERERWHAKKKQSQKEG